MFTLSPSRIARYFFHQCERHLRYFATPVNARKAAGIPEQPEPSSPVTRAILEGGYHWEEKVVNHWLKGKVKIARAKAGTPLRDRVFSVTATLRALQQLQPGEWLYQGALETSASFHAGYALNPEQLYFPPCRPDLIQRVDEGQGAPLYRVVDVKATPTLKTSHRIQVAIYSLLLDHVLCERAAPGAVDLQQGAIWLAETPEPELFDLALVFPHVQAFLRDVLQPVLDAELAEVPWHIYYRCEWCEYFAHCRQEAEEKDSVSQMPYLSVHGRRHLRALNVHSLTELQTLLAHPEAEQRLAGCLSLENLQPLRIQAEALETGMVLSHPTRALAMPSGEQVRLMLTLQREPVSGQVYCAGWRRTGGREVWGSARDEQVFIAAQPAQCAAVQRDFIDGLYEVLAQLDAWNREQAEWSQRLSLQSYVFDQYEAELLRESLFAGLNDPDLAEAALALLFHFQSGELLEADMHPAATETHFPLVALSTVVRRLFALPVPIAWRLGDINAVLPPPAHPDYPPFQYHPSARFTFELSNVMRSDAIHQVWHEGDDPALEAIERELLNRLRASASVVDGIRAHAVDPVSGESWLVAWPPKFQWPVHETFTQPLLSRLAFITRYETLLACLATRERRAGSLEERLRNGDGFRLTALGNAAFEAAPADIALEQLEVDFFQRWLLTADDSAGERAQLLFPDYRLRRSTQKPPARQALAYAWVREPPVARSGSAVVTLDLKCGAASPKIMRGQHYWLHPSFVDFTSDPVIGRLRELDQLAIGRLMTCLLEEPDWAARQQPFGTAVERRVMVAKSRFTDSQRRAFQHLLDHAVTLVWGPPGTGKTHFIAHAVQMLTNICRIGHPRSLRILLTAFTHTAVDNALRKISEMVGADHDLPVVNWGGLKLDGCAAVAEIEAGELTGLLDEEPVCVVGGTVYAVQKALRYDPESMPFDAVIIDEGSQLRVAEALLAISRLAPDGRLLIVGDDRQLPPIVNGVYPDPPPGQPRLQRSIFEALREGDRGRERITCLLYENFRMNEVLCAFPAACLYGAGYQSVDDAVGKRRINLATTRKAVPDWLKAVLSPAHPWTLAVLDGVQATNENRTEAERVAEVAVTLRQRLLNERTGKPWPDTEAGDRDFWRHGLFIVSPHHAQLRAIRAALAARGLRPPFFADTVDKMQGQECQTVIVSYGVADVEYALREAGFIYSLNRLNVAVTRAQAKCVVFLPRPLLEPALEALEIPGAAEGIAFMRALFEHVRGEMGWEGELENGGKLTVYRGSQMPV